MKYIYNTSAVLMKHLCHYHYYQIYHFQWPITLLVLTFVFVTIIDINNFIDVFEYANTILFFDTALSKGYTKQTISI